MKMKMLILITITLTISAHAQFDKANLEFKSSRTVPVAVTGSTTCAENIWGRVFSQVLTVDQFTQGLIAFTNNSKIGSVDSSYSSTKTGVDLQMSAVFEKNRFNAAQSKVLLRIFDSNAGTLGSLKDIVLIGRSGQVLGAGTFEATYGDEHGTVTVRGQRSHQNMIYGQITFSNKAGSNGTLGEFLISNCALAGI